MRARPSSRTNTLRLLIPLVLAVLAGLGEGHAQDSAATPASAPAAQPDPSRRRADSLFARGEAYRARQRFDSARLSYEAAIHADPAAASADTSLARLKTLPRTALERDPFAAARTLSRAGFDEEARAELKKVLAANPDRPVPGDLRHLTGGEIGWWRDVRRWSAQTGRQVLEILSVILTLALVGWWLSRFLFGKPLLQIADFEGTPGAEDDKRGELDGTEFSALVESYLKQLAGAVPLTRGTVQGPVEPVKVPVDVQGIIQAGVPWLSLVLSVMAWLHPQKVLRIHGLLLPAGPQGRGVMLRLTQGDGVVDSITLWERQFLPARAMAQLSARGFSTAQILAQSAATWAMFRSSDVHPRLGSAAPFRALGTTRWRSYALFSAGARLDVHGILPEAEQAYWGALREDADNLGARLNLGAVLVERRRPGLGIRQLQRVSAEAEKLGAPSLRYPALYRECIAWYELAHRDESPPTPHLSRAQALSGQLLGEIDARLRPGSPVSPDLRRALADLYPTAKIVDVGLRATLGHPVEPLAAELGTRYDDVPVGATQYNLASTYAIFAQQSGAGPKERDHWLAKALEHLEFALRLDPRQAASVPDDPSFASLRGDRNAVAKLDKLLRSLEGNAQPASALERVTIIGTYAGKLADAGIKDAAALQARCGTAAGKLGIAMALGITTQTVERWAGVAGLLALPEMNPGAVNALCRAGIDSRAALVRCAPGELTTRLEHLATAAGETDRHEFFEVAAWIASARAN